MKHYFPTIAALAVTFMGTVLVPALKADEWDKRAIFCPVMTNRWEYFRDC
jgi:hypothetical protein